MFKQSTTTFSTLAACVIGALAAMAAAPSQASDPGNVYVLSNQASGNSVLVFHRSGDGVLSYAGAYATGGTGNGNTGADPLGSQGSIVYKEGFVYAVNPGSNDVSVFRASGDTLTLTDRVSSGGTLPVSIDVKGSLVYVLNSGGTPNITGFSADPYSGRLNEIAHSARPLAGGVGSGAAEVHFSADGEALVVTEKNTKLIDSYRVNSAGYASGPNTIVSDGAVPFGFAITRRGYVVVTEPGTQSASSYDLESGAKLSSITSSLALNQVAPCWAVVTDDGRFAFTANAGSSTISSLAIAPDGALSIVNGAAAAPAAPLDMSLAGSGEFLYVRDGNGNLTGYHVEGDGSLGLIGSVPGVPAGSQGIAAR